MKKTFFTFLFFTIFIHSFAQKNVNVKIDSRIEAITIFYTLATRDTLDRKPTSSTYYKDFNSYFEKYKNHKSLNWYRNLDTWDSYDLSIIGLFLTNEYPFKLEIPYSGYQLRSTDMTTFLANFNEFYKDCNVGNFIKTHKREYAKITSFAEKSIFESNVLTDVEKFYNKPSDGEILIYVDILNNLGNNSIEINDEKFKGKKIFKLAYLQDDNIIQNNETEVKFIPLSNVVIHEISHLYLNDFIPKYRERLSKKKNVFLTTAKNEVLKEKVWENELDELIVRVCVSKILGQKFGLEMELKEVENQSKHYKYFKELNLFFNNYTKNRNKYKDISEFYPEIVDFIENLK
ncbi:DUF4932 domain-containing protein [Chryseobacterium sp. FH1]|uniref:DUF4932 domain-containing protein n=1 Tax=Chryseobacterium sp. FH1 TaxID=1233951 RepID=UPI0004E29ED1|nr:DUF4932 domain-containing protein [Chryseobacterium sp. FH1]KFC19522.1 hypothetical protein IO90_09530 [Chryseobacterium sp. FH1]